MDLSSISSPLLEKLDLTQMPRHIAVIMDGNGRWAKKKLLPRIQGHWEGVKTVDRIVSLCRKLDIEALTLYSFSDENWNRPPVEINTLMKILDHYLNKELERMKNENIRFHTIGQVEELPLEIQKLLAHAKNYTSDCDGMTLTLALSYGGRQEILKSVQQIANKVRTGELRVEDIDYSVFESFLQTNSLPEPDLLIRTSGEMRISNFLLYQIAYTELHYTKVLWPEFKEEDLLRAIIDFQKRERRFGMTQEQIIKA
ncbi:MAG TPA: isoprenyl transferase [Nitrospinaceae bacterium]|jgi:undecaprenyl diphosphate synthase|nr:isoprenyl transferase [Nitrospinaceae bacterium]